jgi:general secretion pathway protein G
VWLNSRRVRQAESRTVESSHCERGHRAKQSPHAGSEFRSQPGRLLRGFHPLAMTAVAGPSARTRGRGSLPRANERGGFTLIEILVVISVIAILASLVAPMVFRNVGDAKASATRAQIEILGLALDSYRLDNDYYPSTAQGLEALRTTPSGEPAARNWRGPYLKKNVPPDPYGRPYIYRSPGETNPGAYDLVSLGRDGQPGGSGEDADATSWDGPAR